MAKEFSPKPTSSPAMANMVGLHLLPRVDPKNDTRRTSSPGGCCCFQGLIPELLFAPHHARQLQSPHQAIIPALMSKNPIHIIGGGLAGSEAAWQAAQAGVPVILHEMRPVRGTDAHKTNSLAELVCSNS
ncbi:FAD-dependent oxidoreductase, partial [Mesorhizobium sp. M7D.F.Ca.US.004.03.1.1]|uniref:FAD-dependent oxidoreductase n=1 Tax=Mesorhizobium sp. M7D.F.Ca.US.004.03.1.1 TaxID=2496702 RepID=UPI001FE01A0E